MADTLKNVAKKAAYVGLMNSKPVQVGRAIGKTVKNIFKTDEEKKAEKKAAAVDEKESLEDVKAFLGDDVPGQTFVDRTGNITEKPVNYEQVPNADADTETYVDNGLSKEANEALGTIPKQSDFQIGDKVEMPIVESTEKTEEVAEKVDEIAPENKEEKAAKNKYQKATKSIWQAYLDGDFGEGEEAKRTRNYFILDAVSTFMRNTGKSIQDVAAVYGGGTPSNAENEQSKWSELQNEAFQNEAQADIASEEGTAANLEKRMKELEVISKSLDVQNKPEVIKKQLESMDIMNQLRGIDLNNATRRGELADEFFEKADESSGVTKYIYQALGVYLMSGNPVRDAASLIGGAFNMAM